MEDLKHKLLGFINKQGTKIPSMGFSDETYQSQPVETLSVNSKTVSESDRPADQDILESIEAAYFSMAANFDICRFELNKLPDTLNCDQIERDFKNLKQQQQVVSKKVLQLILEQQTACNQEFQNIIHIKNQLNDTLKICRDGRSELDCAKKEFVKSLGILANYRKRQLVQNLLHSLNTIKTLHCTEDRLQELLNEENYPGAITLLQECHAAAITYRHFNCVAALTQKLQETLVLAEEQLDQALAKICYEFDSTTYSKLQGAYRLLGKTQTAMDQLLMHYTSAIHNTAFSIVHSYASNSENLDGGKRQYKQLCTCVAQKDFISCLIELCKSLFIIMLSYYQLVNWHSRNIIEEKEIIIINDSQNQQHNLEENFDKQYIKKKLENGLTRVWHDVQSKVSVYLMNSDLAWYKFEQFVQVLSIVHRLIEVGEEFCGSKSEELQDSIKKQSFNYFKNYHTSRLEELKIFLENESWEICPVKSKFDILQLQEFKSLRSVLKNFKTRPISVTTTPGINSPDCNSSNHSQDGSSVSGNFFNRYTMHSGTPFDLKLDETLIEEDFLADVGDEASGYCSDDSEDEADELKKDYVDEYTDDTTSKHTKLKKDKHSSKAPILTNTTLTVLRQMGKYLQMSRLLRPIAFDIICCMNQLYDFYLFAVHTFFASDLTISSSSLYSKKLISSLNRISDQLILDPIITTDETTQTQSHNNRDKITKPLLSPIVNLSQPESLNGLAERIVAVESLVFLSKQFEFLQGYLEHLVQGPNKKMLQQFYNQTICIATDVRRPVYMSVVAHAFDLRQILIHMSKVNWEVKDVMSQHSSYIDMLLREIQIFTMRMEDVSNKVTIPKEIYNSLWENIAHIVTHTLVEGFAFTKKCTNGGRALMQLDFTQLQSKFEKISGLRPMPHREYVESYVKAYYLPEIELDKWIREHSEYSSKHMLSLVSCACQNNKKTKQKLIATIEEMEKTGVR